MFLLMGFYLIKININHLMILSLINYLLLSSYIVESKKEAKMEHKQNKLLALLKLDFLL